MARTRRAAAGTAERSVTGRAMVDHRTKRLVSRLQPGDVAVIDHEDIDRVAAESLVEARPAAVLNVARSSSGRYANVGPLLLVRAGIVLVDDLGPALLEEVAEGDTVTIEDYKVIDGDRFIAAGIRQDVESIEAVHERSRARLGTELSLFAQNTVDYVEDNQDLLTDDLDVPALGDWTGRHVLIVVRGHDYKEDLAHLRASGYLREMQPLVVAVDGGADELLDSGVTPDVIVGDMDSVSEAGLSCGAELVVHAYRDGRAPGAQRLEEMGLEYHTFSASGTSEDIAMLMAWDLGAELIVAVGTHSSMVDFLDKGRAGMASTVLTRMKVGPILVDAKGVSRIYGGRLRKRDLLLLVAAALFAMVVVIIISEPIRLLIRTNWVLLTGTLGAIT